MERIKSLQWKMRGTTMHFDTNIKLWNLRCYFSLKEGMKPKYLFKNEGAFEF